MVESLVKKNDDGTVQKGGIALGNFDNIPAAKDIITALILQAGGKITGLDNQNVLRSQLADQTNAAAAVKALDFYTEFADPAQADYSWSHAFQNAQASFAAGDVAMYVGHASEFGAISQKNPNLNFAMAPIPQIRSGQYTMDISDIYALSLTRTTKNAQGALTIAYLMAAPEFMTPIAKSLGMASALRRAISSSAAPITDPALKNLVSNAPQTPETLLDQEANISKAWIDPDPDKTSALFRDMIENTVSGELKSSDAVQRADKQMSAILNP
jgi:maltose-binding protein MalE